MNDKIDFVILWVDGNDEKWLKEKNKYKKMITGEDISNNVNRFRDWDLLRYWFRGVEKNASWVNRIHFVTWGHIPSWLDTTNPKLNIVKHEDFIPKEYLPTFNSNVIQFYLNRIEGLSERFVMFDDDIYVIDKTKKEDFFVGDKICDNFGERIFNISKPGDVYPHAVLNNIQYINKKYSKKEFYKRNFFKIYSFKNGFLINFRTFMSIIYHNFVGINHEHICMSYTKKHYGEFWDLCGNDLLKCSSNKFRDYSDLTTLMVRYIALLNGEFVPRSINFGKRFELNNNNDKLYSSIINKKYKVLCINDSNPDIDFESTQKKLIESFEYILPEKSSFEK